MTNPTWEEIKNQYEEQARSAIVDGFTIELDPVFETCSIEHKDHDPDFCYFFEGHEYEELINRIPQELVNEGLSVEDYLLASSMNW